MANQDRPTVPSPLRFARPLPSPDSGSTASRWGALIAAWLEPVPEPKPARVVRSKAPARRQRYAADRGRDCYGELHSGRGLNLRPSTSFDDWASAKPSVFRVHVDLVPTEIDRGAQRFSSRDRVISSRDGASRIRVASF